jgi:hypothetical protein
MNGWRTNVRCYVSPADNNKIADWYDGLSVQERSDADAFLKNMRRMAAKDWKMPDYRAALKGYKGLGELRWISMKKQHRLIGFFKDGVWYAVVGCTHKQQVYDPHDALDTAKRYKGQIERGEVITVDYNL